MSNEHITDFYDGRRIVVFADIYWIIVVWISYNEFVFKTIGDLSSGVSRLILAGMVVTGTLAGIAVDKVRRNNRIRFAHDLMIGYAVYTIAAYWQTQSGPMIITVLITLSVIGLFVWNEYKKMHGSMIPAHRWTARTVRSCKNILCCGMAVLILQTGVAGVVKSSALAEPSVKASADDVVWTVPSNIETLKNLQQETWKTVDLTTKINTLHVVINIERCRLRLPDQIGLAVVDLSDHEGLLGYYDGKLKQVVLSQHHVQLGESCDVLNTCLHEMQHAAQEECVIALDYVPEDLQQLSMFDEARVYKRELTDYKAPDEEYGFTRYYNQFVERSARSEAEKMTEWYFQMLEEYQRY